MSKNESGALSEQELQELVAASDSGARSPTGAVGIFIAGTALVWSIFQVLLLSILSCLYFQCKSLLALLSGGKI